MSNYTSLNAYINANIKQNGKREITGQILNAVLNAMVNTLGAGYQFAGVATPASNPGTPDAKVFYIANGKGTYTNFGSLDVTEDEVVILYLDSAWHKMSTGIALKSDIPDISDKADKATTLAGYGIGDAYTKSEVDDALEGKQDTIADLEAIRQGAAKGSTALQSESDPVYLADKPSLALKTEIPDISDKADKATTLAGYGIGDAYTKGEVDDALGGKQEKLVAGDNITIVGNVISSTGGGGGEGGGGSIDLSAYAKKADVESALEGKQDTISDLDAIREGAAKGSTALQSESDPVYLADKPSLALKTEIPDISDKADKATTLAGYGIGDAYTKSEVDAAISSAITTTLNTEV